MISDPIDIELNRMCGECFMPLDLLPPPKDDGLGCARGTVNALVIMGVIYAALFAGAWVVRWLQR